MAELNRPEGLFALSNGEPHPRRVLSPFESPARRVIFEVWEDAVRGSHLFVASFPLSDVPGAIRVAFFLA